MSTETVIVNKGYQIVERKNTVDAYFAYNVVLSTEKQFKYTRAEYTRSTDSVELTRHICICPHCGYNMPAYEHFFHGRKPKKRMTRSKAAEWCGDIKSMFDNEDRAFSLYTPVSPQKEFWCPICGRKSQFSHKTENITFEKKKGTIKVSCNIESIIDIFDIKWAPTIDIISLPLRESVVFNLKKGTVFFELSTPEGFLMRVRDVTNGIPVGNQTSKLIHLINDNNFVKRKLMHCFDKMWNKRIPFSVNELDLQKFIHLTSYVGYSDKSFYHNIPSANYDFTFDTTFKKVREQLHNSENCIELMSKSNLPQSKSIKKLLFSNPSFFFYLNEIEILWKLFEEDHNLLSRFLDSRNAFANLFMMHTYPSIVEFYRDFAREKTSYEFFKLITFFDKTACKYGIYYSAFSDSKKALERKAWKELTGVFKMGYHRLGMDIHIDGLFTKESEHPKAKELKDQNHNGYTFSVLRTRNQCVMAGEQLDNCLKSAHFRNPIIGMMKYGHYVAAIEVDLKDNTVVQALITDNEDIENDRAVFLAFKKWCKINNLCYNKSEYPYVDAF